MISVTYFTFNSSNVLNVTAEWFGFTLFGRVRCLSSGSFHSVPGLVRPRPASQLFSPLRHLMIIIIIMGSLSGSVNIVMEIISWSVGGSSSSSFSRPAKVQHSAQANSSTFECVERSARWCDERWWYWCSWWMTTGISQGAGHCWLSPGRISCSVWSRCSCSLLTNEQMGGTSGLMLLITIDRHRLGVGW